MIERDEYDDHMDEMVLRMSRVVDREKNLDVASAAACMVGYAVRKAFSEPAKRLQALNDLYKFMQKVAMELRDDDYDYARGEEDAQRKRDAAEGFPDG